MKMALDMFCNWLSNTSYRSIIY